MPLAKRQISVNFAQGLDTKSDPHQVQGKVLALENGVFTSPGKVKKRNGYKKVGLPLNPLDEYPAKMIDQFYESAVSDSCFNAKWKAIESFVQTIDAKGCMVVPGLVDACARVGEPGHGHEGMLDSELAAAVAGGVTSVVCPPDTQPVLDEPGLVEMLQYRAARLHLSRVFPLGALTRGLAGESLTPMAELTMAGCVGFSQAEQGITQTQTLQRAMQYAAIYLEIQGNTTAPESLSTPFAEQTL